MLYSQNSQERAAFGIPGVPWRERPFVSVQDAAEILGVGTGSIYNFQKTGSLTLKRLGGRTLVDVESLVQLIGGAEPFTPQDHRTRRATAARVERSRLKEGQA